MKHKLRTTTAFLAAVFMNAVGPGTRAADALGVVEVKVARPVRGQVLADQGAQG